jgi:hypothetical protein
MIVSSNDEILIPVDFELLVSVRDDGVVLRHAYVRILRLTHRTFVHDGKQARYAMPYTCHVMLSAMLNDVFDMDDETTNCKEDFPNRVDPNARNKNKNRTRAD